jgi:hypothetical protein
VATEQQIADLDRKVIRFARNNAQVQRFTTATRDNVRSEGARLSVVALE